MRCGAGIRSRAAHADVYPPGLEKKEVPLLCRRCAEPGRAEGHCRCVCAADDTTAKKKKSPRSIAPVLGTLRACISSTQSSARSAAARRPTKTTGREEALFGMLS